MVKSPNKHTIWAMSSLVDVETFKDILSFQYKLNPKTLYKDCIKAIEYYLSNDDFLDE